MARLIPYYGRQGVYNLITVHAPIFTMYVAPTEVKEVKLKTFILLILCFLLIQPSKVLGC